MGIERRLQALEDILDSDGKRDSGLGRMEITHTKEDGTTEVEVWERDSSGTGFMTPLKVKDYKLN